MKPRHYHNPIKAPSSRVPCPVCHEATYSTAGIHPQCAIRLSDPPRPKSAPPVVAAEHASVEASTVESVAE